MQDADTGLVLGRNWAGGKREHGSQTDQGGGSLNDVGHDPTVLLVLSLS